MSTYELTVLFPEGKEKEKTRVIKMVADFAKKQKGELMKQESWGVKSLAYPMAKQTRAEYEHFVLALSASDQPKLDRLLGLDEAILRYLFVKV